MKIYTKQGDQGQTSLWGGRRILKDDVRLDAYGTLDELSSFIGLLIADLDAPHAQDLIDHLKDVQILIFHICSQLATADSAARTTLPSLQATDVTKLERLMDEWSATLQPLKAFILPGGTRSASLAHICRTVCRRAERHTVSLLQEDQTYPEEYLRYLNRLSDFFFTLARVLNARAGRPDELWDNARDPSR